MASHRGHSGEQLTKFLGCDPICCRIDVVEQRREEVLIQSPVNNA
jgi:hypothetical protein